MGWDIHIRIERFDNNRWVPVRYAAQPWHTREEAETTHKNTCAKEGWTAHDAAVLAGAVSLPGVFDSRNYYWFNLLAGVGEDKWVPIIAARRGLPADTAYWDDGEDWLGDLGLTWVSLEELEAYPWDTTFYESMSAREMSADWPGQVLPILRAISQGKPLRLLIGFDS